MYICMCMFVGVDQKNDRRNPPPAASFPSIRHKSSHHMLNLPGKNKEEPVTLYIFFRLWFLLTFHFSPPVILLRHFWQLSVNNFYAVSSPSYFMRRSKRNDMLGSQKRRIDTNKRKVTFFLFVHTSF